MKNKKIFILGGSGFVGSHLTRSLVSLGAEVTILCRNPNEVALSPAFKGAKLRKGSVTERKDIERYIADKDVIINLATVVYNTSVFEPYSDLQINCLGQINTLEARREKNSEAKYIYIGSSMQFGKIDEKKLPLKEDFCQNPISLYGTHKTGAENYCRIYERAYGLPSIILRFPPLYGPSLTGKPTRSIVEKFIKKSLSGETFNVNGFGTDLKDFLYVSDAVNSIVKSIESPLRSGIFNVGSGAGIPLKEVALMITRECKMGQFALVPFPDNLIQFEVGSFYFDISKIKKELGWTPSVNLRDGIKKMVAFYRDGKEMI